MSDTSLDEAVTNLAADLTERRARLAVAESLTSGAVGTALGRGPDTQQWFAGSVVAYQMATKTHVLGVDADIDPCSAECAIQLATGVRRLVDTDYAVAVTGVGGPDADDAGHPAGTVYIAAVSDDASTWRLHEFDGDPAAVIAQSVEAAVALLREVVNPVSGARRDA
ncbi:CinA family protein [Microbacterium sp. ACRRU]|uniref:CinA family protein n=1 Tax=Microbacterium sp. ACRRU TaxID=2918204 RepID=UPI001EF6E6A6|nr:CinA family protein [Microbacterium sp. ACRRU]MCG7417990.1 CinA family protein [Microbacterium sp. ACRRU]